MSARSDLAYELRAVADGLAATERSFRERHVFGRSPHGGDVPPEAALDVNGRPILADLLAARGQVLAALANLDRETP